MLGQSKVPVERRYYFKEKPSLAEIRALAAGLPGGARELISTRSTRYKELGLNVDQIGEAEAVELLAAEPKLWRRPIITDGERVLVGYNPATMKELMGAS